MYCFLLASQSEIPLTNLTTKKNFGICYNEINSSSTSWERSHYQIEIRQDAELSALAGADCRVNLRKCYAPGTNRLHNKSLVEQGC